MTQSLPRGWAAVELREVAVGGLFVDGDWVESKDQDPHGRVRLVQLADIGAGAFLDKSSRFLTEEKAAELGCTFLESGDVLISRMADPIGRACIFQGDARPCVTVVDVCIVRPNASVADNTWLAAAINSPQFRSNVELAASGTTRSRVSRSNLGALRLPVPPLEEQRRIVAKLESLQARSRRAREALDAVPPLLEKLRQSILAAAFRGDLTKDWRAKHPNPEPATDHIDRIRNEHRKKWEETERARLLVRGKLPTDGKWKSKYEEPQRVDATSLPTLPSGWCWASLDELLVSLRNGIATKPDLAEGLRILRISAVRPLRVDLDDVRFLPPDDTYRDYLLKEGDLLLTRYNGNPDLVGVAGVVRKLQTPTVYPDKLIRASIVPAVTYPAFIELAINTGATRKHIAERAKSAAGQVGVSGSDIRSAPVPVPPLAEQDQIVRAVATVLLKNVSTMRQVGSVSVSLDQFDTAIMAKAFRGELVPQDPSDEPAEALLARLRGNETSPTLAKSKPRGRRSKAAE